MVAPPELTALRADTAIGIGPARAWAISAAKAFGGDAAAGPVMAAIERVQAGVAVLDQIFDDEVSGLHRRIGAGRAINLAMILGLDALDLADQAWPDSERWRLAVGALGRAMRETARARVRAREGGGRDAAESRRIAEGTSVPLIAMGLELGALAAGACPANAMAASGLASPIARLMRIRDELQRAGVASSQHDGPRTDRDGRAAGTLIDDMRDATDRARQVIAVIGAPRPEFLIAAVDELQAAAAPATACTGRGDDG